MAYESITSSENLEEKVADFMVNSDMNKEQRTRFADLVRKTIRTFKEWLGHIMSFIRDELGRQKYNNSYAEAIAKNSDKVEKLLDTYISALDHIAEMNREGRLAEVLEGKSDGITYYSKSESENSSIKQQIIAANKTLARMDAVVEIEYESQSKKEIKDLAIEKFKKLGFKVDRQGYGIVLISEKEINEALNYIGSDGEKAALLAVPEVLKRGIEISGHDNHKKRNYSTITIAAPVEINGVRGNMAVVVKESGKNRYKTHRILLPNNSEFVFDIKKSESTSAGVKAGQENRRQRSAINSDSADIIPHPIPEVKTYEKNSFSFPENSGDEDGEETSVEKLDRQIAAEKRKQLNHIIAKDGFTYRRAYFKDFDGQYYKLTMSIGKNGNTAAVYNVGKIEKDTLPSAQISAVVGSKARGKVSSENSISDISPKVKTYEKNSYSFPENSGDEDGEEPGVEKLDRQIAAEKRKQLKYEKSLTELIRGRELKYDGKVVDTEKNGRYR